MKRSLAILFALLLTLSTAPAVFAEDTGEAAPAEGQETIIEETVSEDAEPIVPEEETEILLIEEEADVLLADGTGEGTGAEETPTEDPVEEERPTIDDEETDPVGCTADVVTDGNKLSGTLFGTKQWGADDPEAGDRSYNMAFDGDISTFYDAYNATIDAHVGMNVGTATQLTEVHIVPRNANGYDPEVEVLEGSGGFEYEDGNEFHNNLFDRDINSGWCQELTDEISEYYVTWKTSRPMEVLGYNLYTSYDTAEYPERNPIGWTLYGSVDGDEWIVIDKQEDNHDLPSENAALYSVYCPVETTDENGETIEVPHPSYEYFKLTIDDVEGGIFQLGEFRLLESDVDCTRMEGMTVQGSTDGELWANLYTFPGEQYYGAQPYVITADDMNFVNEYSFTQFRVINTQQHFNVAEVEFYGVDGSELEAYPDMIRGEHKLNDEAAIFGSEGSFDDDPDVTFDKAFDGDTSTFFDPVEGEEQEVGIALGNPAKLTGIRVFPRAEWSGRMNNLTIQGSVSGNDWITLYQFPEDNYAEDEYAEVTEEMLASAAQDYAFTQFRVINKADHLNVAEVEFYGTYDHDLETFPMIIEEPIYSYITADQFINSVWVHREENDPENPDDDHYLDFWYFNEEDEEGMTRFAREFEGRDPIVLIGGVGFDDTVLDIQDIDGKPIIAVAPYAFVNEDGIRKVIVNEYSDCKYIMNNAFAECHSIETVEVSNALHNVESEAFRHNWNLREFIKNDDDFSDEDKDERAWMFVEVIDGALVARADAVVCYPPAADNVPEYRVPDSVHHIDGWAFAGADIDKITMGHNVLRVNYGAFSDCTAHTIELSPALQYLGDHAFAGCTNLTSVLIPSDKVEINCWENGENGEREYNDDMFADTVDRESEEPRADLVVKTYEGGMVHEYIDYIHSLELEGYDMSHVKFEEEIETYWYGFDWWEECGENEVFLVGYSAPLDAEITTMPTETYDGKNIIGIRTDGDAWQAFRNDERVCGGENKTFVIPEGIRYIYDVPFDNCDNIETVVLPASLKDVYAPFLSCHGLKNFVTTQGGTFYTDEDGAVLYYTYNDEVLLAAAATNCGKTEIEVLDGTGCIIGAAFEGNLWLESVILPESLYAIDWWAFGNTPLKSITIPANVDRIMPGAFAECPDLTEVKIERLTGEFCSRDWNEDFSTVFADSPNVLVTVYAGTDAERAAEEYGWNYRTVEVTETVYDLYTANDGVHLRGVVPATGETKFVIPNEVQVIDDRAFVDMEITSVTFPKNLRYISHEAFAGCGEFEVKFAGIAQFGWEGSSFDNEEAFRQTYEAFIPDWHFDGKFAYILAPSVQEAWIDAWWYTAVDENGVMNVPSTVEVDGVTYDVVLINGGALSEYAPRDRVERNIEDWDISREWTYPTSIVLPDSIRYIGGDAFAHHNYWDEENEVHNGLESVTLPKEVKWIENGAFVGSWLITEFKNLDAYGAESDNPYRLTSDGAIVSVWDENYLHTYPYGSTATEYTVPDDISGIGNSAFHDAMNLVSVTLPEGVRWLDNEAFAWCENLKKISLPSTLEDISHGAFRGCDKLTDIVLPKSNDRYFVHEDGTLRADEGDTIAVLPLGLVDENGHYTISEGVKGMWSTSMASQRLTELVIPASMEWMNGLSFEDCGNLRKVTFNGTFEDNLPLSAFAYCHNLEEIVYYGDYVHMFVNDHDIDDRTIATEHDENGNVLHDEDGNRITRKFDFRLMNKDAEVSLAVIRDDDWKHPDYDTMNPDDNPYFRLIRGMEPYFETYTAHDGVHLSGAYNMSGDIVIPEDVMIIDDDAFAGMEITSVTFPKNLIRIGNRAFAGCGEFDVIATGGVQIGWQKDSFDFDFEKVYNEQIFTDNVLINNLLYRFTRKEGVNEAMVTAWWYDAVKDGVLNIPGTVEYSGVTYTVVSLEDGALSEYAPGYVRGEGFVAGDGEWTYPTSIILPDTVRYVGYEAFGCHGYYTEERGDYGLESVTLPADILYINEGAFMDSYQIREFKGLDAFGESENPYQLLDGAVISVWRDDFTILIAYPPECGNTEYTVSGEIEMISNNAFKWAEELQTLTLEEGVVEIGDHAFMHCYSLQTLNLPASLEVINDAAFSYSNNLREINIPEENEHFDLYADGTLRADDGETLILYPVGTMEEPRVLNIPDGIKEITCVGLAGMGFTEIHVPASVERINDWAFEHNRDLTKVVIHGNINQMNMNVFAHAENLKEVIYHGDHINLYYDGDENEWIDIAADNGKFDFVLVNEDAGISYSIQRGDNVNDRDYDTYHPDNNPHFRLVRGENNFVMYTADDGVHLQRVRNVSGDIEIPEEVMIIDDEAFKGIEITSVTFPANLRWIGHEAFAGCGDQFEVKFTGATVLGWEGDAFDFDFNEVCENSYHPYNRFDGEFSYWLHPAGWEGDANEATVQAWWYTAVKNDVLTVPETVEFDGVTYTVVALEEGALSEYAPRDRIGYEQAEEMGISTEWTYPTSIVLPDTIRFIGGEAFAHHDYWDDETEKFVGLETVQLPKSVQWIERNAFNCCLRITSFTNLDAFGDKESSNPYRLTEDGSIVNVWSDPILYAYPVGKADTSYTIPDGIVGIGWAAFNNASNLVTVTIPEGVRWLDNESFAYCSNLEKVCIPSTLEDISHGSFRGCNRLTDFILPEEAGENFFIHEDGTLRSFDGKSIVVFPLGRVPEDGKLEISDDVEGIFGAAAAGSDRLTELVLPESIEWISDCAFEGSEKLRTVTIKRGENRELAFNLNVFAWNPSLETIVYEGDVLEFSADDDLVVRNEKDEVGNDVFDENGNNIHIPFKLVVSEDCDVRCEDFDVNDNPHFNLLRGTSETVYGDVNGDGEATEDDALYLLRHTILSDRYLLSEGNHNYDESEDGKITAKDAVALKNIISNQ